MDKKKAAEYQKQWRIDNIVEVKERDREYYQKNRNKILLQQKEYHKSHKLEDALYHERYNTELRMNVLTHYGNGKCECVRCGFNDIRALTLDHINGDGVSDRIKFKNNSINFFRYLVKNNYPEGYQTLCMNCNYLKRTEDMNK